VTLIVGGGGLYWLVPAIILALVGGMLNAWQGRTNHRSA